MTDCVQVFMTIDSKEGAEKIAKALLRRRLAACVQVCGPVTSTYRWQGKIETSEEWLCLIKSTTALCDELETVIRELHPYEVPEILAVPVVAGSQRYLDWLKGELGK